MRSTAPPRREKKVVSAESGHRSSSSGRVRGIRLEGSRVGVAAGEFFCDQPLGLSPQRPAIFRGKGLQGLVSIGFDDDSEFRCGFVVDHDA